MRDMKDSGIIWFGEMPEEWKNHRLKDCISVLTDYTANGSFATLAANVEYLDEGYARLVRLTDLRVNFDVNGVYVSEDAYSFLNKSALFGDEILVANVGAYAGLMCEMPRVDFPATLGPNMFLLITDKKKLLPHYLFLLSMSKPVSEQLVMKATATAQPKLNKQDVKTIFVVLPNIKEQQVICDVLDGYCTEVDALTADIQAQLETLEKYKRSVITETVTKGLNSDTAMKDSGIEYVGIIPAHWDMHPVYYYFAERKNKNIFGKEDNLLSLSYGRIIRKDINTNEGLLPESFNTYNIVEAGDIIIRPTDLQNDKRSLRTGLVKERGIITSAYIALKPKAELVSAYYHYLLHSFDVMKVFYNMGNGVRQGLNFSEFARLMVFAPPIDEQQAIASFLDEKCVEIDSAIATKKTQLETLDEYKKSVIYEYVTGKNEVAV